MTTFSPALALQPSLSSHKNPAINLSDNSGAPPPNAVLVSAVNFFNEYYSMQNILQYMQYIYNMHNLCNIYFQSEIFNPKRSHE